MNAPPLKCTQHHGHAYTRLPERTSDDGCHFAADFGAAGW